jgi:orotidine-5'-phosphate decarboxylase
MTPRQALAQGADFLVMGRAILNHSNPDKAIELIHKEIAAV